VEDNGAGVSRELLKKLNKKSYETERSEGNHGLGLKIVKQVASRHKWKISFHEGEMGGFVCEMILKNDKMNLAIQKLTEIGVNRIIPLKTERVVVKINEKKEKWDVVVREALKQCRGIKFTEITPVKKLAEIDYSKYDKIIFAYENSGESKSLSEIIEKEDKNILYIIGPEGGITQEEVDFLKNSKAMEISLGKRILRAETAAIVVCGIIANFYM